MGAGIGRQSIIQKEVETNGNKCKAIWQVFKSGVKMHYLNCGAKGTTRRYRIKSVKGKAKLRYMSYFVISVNVVIFNSLFFKVKRAKTST